MRLQRTALHYGAFVVALLVLLLWAHGGMWSMSVDTAHHYALVKAIMDHGFRPEYLPNLGEMNYYPPLSHYLAAWSNWLFPSGFKSMLMIGVISVFLSYLSLLLLLSGFAGATAVVLLITTAAFGWPLHGDEIVGNYFFSQIVASASVYASLLILQSRLSSWKADALAATLAVVIAYTHLMPALQFLAAYGLMIFFSGIFGSLQKWRIIVWAAFCAAFMWLHPSVAMTAVIGSHEGELHLPFLGELTAQIIAIAIGISTGGAAVVRAIKTNQKGILTLGCLSLGCSIIAAGLLLGHQFVGLGSYYGFKKTLFSVVTLALLCLVALLPRIKLSIAPPVVASIGALLLTFSVFGAAPYNADRVDLLRAAVAQTGLIANVSVPETPVTIVAFPEMPNSMNYMFSIAELYVPRDERGMGVFTQNLDGISGVEGVITNDAGVCPATPRGPVVTISFECWLRQR